MSTTSTNISSTIQQARQLGSTEPDEAEPYKHRYAAADVLQQLLEQSCCSIDTDAAAWCKIERGLQLLETDLLAEGQKALEEGLQHATASWPGTVECLAMQMRAHNALAGLWCERSEHETALQHLQAAVELYNRSSKLLSEEQCKQKQLQQQPPAAATAAAAANVSADATSTSSSAVWQAALFDVGQLEADHTTTLFFMAQVYGLMGDRMRSASYCAATLNRQLQQGDPLDVNEWVQNCLQLSGCFLDCNAFALSRHCCAAVEALLLQRHQQQQQHQQQQEGEPCSCDTTPGSRQSKDTAGQQQQQQEQQQEAPSESVSSGGNDQTVGSKDQADKQQQDQQQQLKGTASKTQPQQEGQQQDEAVAGGPSAALLAALSVLEKDVAANVCLAFAKMHLYCLVASHEAHVEGKQVPFGFSSAAEVPAVLSFDALPGLPPLSSLPWGAAALVAGFDGALGLFKAALPWFKAALEHYQLDGWVTEHCNILFEMSNLYRCLAGFEPDPHKRCVMHRSRAKLLQPLEGQLSTTHYPGMSRSISLELGNIFREIADIKAAAGREPDKVAGAMQSAAVHYKLFLDSFREEPGAPLPDKVEPEMQQHYLSGMFSMARMLQGLPGTGTLTGCRRSVAGGGGGGGAAAVAADAEAMQEHARREVVTLEEATSLLGSLVKYVGDNKVEEWEEQAAMAQELAGLLQEKLALVRQVHQLC